MQALKKLGAGNNELKLPTAEKLRLPLRSTADADLIATGALHEVTIELILCKRARWFQKIELTVADFPPGKVKESCVPPSLLHNKLCFANGISKIDETPDLASSTEVVAVIGMACRFPQVDSKEEFWQLLVSAIY